VSGAIGCGVQRSIAQRRVGAQPHEQRHEHGESGDCVAAGALRHQKA